MSELGHMSSQRVLYYVDLPKRHRSADNWPRPSSLFKSGVLYYYAMADTVQSVTL